MPTLHTGYGTNNPGSLIVSQMDPNGIYSSPSTAGTYVICVLNNGQKYAMYWEGPVFAVAGGAVWQDGQIKVNGAPTYTVTTGKGK